MISGLQFRLKLARGIHGRVHRSAQCSLYLRQTGKHFIQLNVADDHDVNIAFRRLLLTRHGTVYESNFDLLRTRLERGT